ncbi:MAG: tRNA adenosine deaminase-associated protein [Frankiaceae bacterium]|jgi:putative tRNA adenosine deaminase-associated protein|nr:tRNA adenosine deaminase-associated protein [Frankiaceae bacterium]
MASEGFAIAMFREDGLWRAEPLPPSVVNSLDVLLSALRSQPPEGGPFIVADVDEEFFLIVRLDGARISMLLSDLTAAADYPLAAQALERLGEDPPEDDELDEACPAGDLDILSDLGLPESELELLLEDDTLYPDELLEDVMGRIDLGDQFVQALRRAR